MKTLFICSLLSAMIFALHSCGMKSVPVSMDAYYSEKEKCDSLKRSVEVKFLAFLADTTIDSVHRAGADDLYIDMLTALDKIDYYREQYLAEMGGSSVFTDTTDKMKYLTNPSDYEIAQSFFLGEDAENPDGKALQLYDNLAEFRGQLDPDISFFIPVKHTETDKIQWAKDNFYHATGADVMVRFQLYELNVCQALNSAMDQKLFFTAQ